MKVLHLCTSDRGGAGIAAARLHSSMVESGVDSHLLTYFHFDKSISNHPIYRPDEGRAIPSMLRLYYFLRKALDYSGLLLLPHRRIAKAHLKGRPPGFENFSFCFSIYDIKKHPLYKQADIIHLHWISEGFIDFISFFKNTNKKIVWTLHDMNPFTGGCHHSDDCRGFTGSCQNCPQLKNTIDTEYAAEILARKKNVIEKLNPEQIRIVTPSAWLGNLSSASSLFGKFIHRVIPNGVDENKFRRFPMIESRKLLDIDPDKKVILFISHTISHPRKGITYLKNVLRRLNRNDIVVVSVGATGNEMTDDIGILNLGYVSDEEQMARIYSAADLFVLPSLAENFPNTICESLFCGVPVVSFRVGGIPEMINVNNGVLAELRNEESLYNAIKRILDNPELFSHEKIREAAIADFSARNSVIKYLDIYNSFR